MKKTKSGFVMFLLLAVLAVTALAVTVSAAASVTYEGGSLFAFAPGSVYTESDLFDSFKNVMPGDTLTESITVVNKSKDFDYVKVYLKAIPHDENDNPINSAVLAQLTADERRGEMSELEYMLDFLYQLDLKVTCGSELFNDKASMNGYKGDLVEGVLIGELSYGNTAELEVEIKVPDTLGNEYASRIGEVDWTFVVEGFSKPVPPLPKTTIVTVRKVWDDYGFDRPESVKVQLLCDDEPYAAAVLSEENQWAYTWSKLDPFCSWDVVEADVPEGYTVSYDSYGNSFVITNTRVYTPPIHKKDDNPPEEEKEPDIEEEEKVPEIIEEPEVTVEPINLTVHKAWDDNGSKNRPESAKITLYQGETAVETVWLGEWNDWTYSWNGLAGDSYWQAIEDEIPDGYAPVYTYENGTVTITNTAILIQTGQVKWPVPVFGGLGIALVAWGVIFMTKKRKDNEA